MRTIITTVVIAAVAISPYYSYANPVGGTVVGGNGNATITGQGTAVTTVNQTANKVVINWQEFSIGAGELTRFVQPSATAAALNRVIGGNPSLIYGSLQSNGRVFVINPNGILVGPSGQIDTKSFIASTMNVRNSEFMSKANLIFSGDSAAGIRNEGSIKALGGDVFLIAKTVENAGSISAPQGTVGLAAGSRVQLVQSGTERISVLAGSSTPAEKGVDNSGTIHAASAELKAAGGNIYALAINNGGVVRADGIVNRNGRVYLGATGGNVQNSGTLVAKNADGSGGTVVVDGGHNATAPATVINSGTIDAAGAAGTRGGDVRMLGDHVGLVNNALVNVSGDAGGGTALIGGDYQGGNSAVQNADRTFIGPDARILADAISQGNGGKVVVWANDVTRFFGNISARGGALGGNGGFAEVSGHNSLVYQGHVDLQSPVGFMGTLLLDPKFIIIATGGGASVAGNDEFSENPAGTSTISPANLVTALNSADVNLRASTDITITDAIDASAGAANDLILQAGKSILVNANITLAGAFDGTINDNAANATVANRDPGLAVFTMAVGTTITAPGGITITGGTLAADSGGATTIAANLGDISLQNLSTRGLSVGAATAGNNGGAVSIVNSAAATKNITIAGGIDARGSDAQGGGNHAGGNGGLVTLNASGVLSVNSVDTSAGVGVGTGDGGDAGNVLATGTTGITLNNNVTSLGGAGSPNGANGNQTYNNLLTLGNDVILNGGVISFGSTINGARDLTVTGSGAPVFSAAIGGTTPLVSFTVNSAAAFTFNRDVTAGSISLNSGTDGTGSLDFAAGVDINADTQSYRAGDGLGGGAAAAVDLNGNTPNFRNSAGLATPVSFTHRQDAAIADSDIASAARFGGTPPATYTIQSDEGGITVSTGTKVAGSALTLLAADALAINTSLTLASIFAHSGTDGGGDLAFGAGVTVNADNQSYRAGDDIGGGGNTASVNLTGNTPDFRDTLGGVAPTSFTYRQDAAITSGDLPAASQFGGTQPGNYTIQSDEGGVQLPAMTLPGTLQVVANGNITQSGALDVSAGASTFTIKASTIGDVLLGGQANHFAGQTVTFNAINGGAVRDVSLRNIDATAVFPTLPAGLRNFTLEYNAAAVTLPTLTLSGNLSVTAGGVISDSGNLAITGTTALAAGVNNIILDNANNFGGAVSIASAVNVTLNDVNALTLGLTTIAGNLQVTANGLISDSGNVSVGGITALAAGAANDITLDNANNFGGTVAILSGNNVTLNDVNTLTLDNSTISGNLNLTASGLISDSGNISVVGTTTLAAGSGNDITLDNINNFGGAVSITSGNNVTLNDINALTLGLSTVSGNLAVTAAGLISDSGNVAVNGTTSLAAGAANDITLNNANNFGGAVSILSGNNVTLNDINALTLGGSTVSGNLAVTAVGLISDNGNLTVNGTTTLAAGAANDITLDNANDFVGAVQINSGDDVTLNDVNSLLFAASTISGNLAATAAGNITQNGALTVTAGSSTFTINTVANGDVLLGGQANHFAGQTVTINTINGGVVQDVSLRNVDGTAVFPTLPANLRNLTIQFNSAAATLTALNLSGNLDVTAGGLISDAGNLIVNGTTTLAAGGNDVTLNNANDFVGAVQITGGQNVTLNDVNALTLAASTVAGNLNLTANGLISDSGNLSVNGTTTLAAGAANDITLDNANDFIGAVSINSGRNVTLNDVNTLNMGASTVAQNLILTAGGAVSQSGTISALGLSLSAGGSTTLNGNNDVDVLAAAISGNGNTFSFTDVDDLTIGLVNTLSGVSTANGAVALTADTMGIGQTVNSGTARTTLQPLTAGRNINLGTETGGQLSITDAELDLITASALQIGNATAGAIDVSAPVSPAGASQLSLLTGGAVSGVGSITVAGLRISSVGSATLTGNNDVNNLAVASSGAGNTIRFFDVDDLVLTTVDGVNGVTANNGPVSIATANGSLTVNNTPAPIDVEAGTSSVDLTAGGANNALTIAPGAAVHGSTKVTFTADTMVIGGAVTAVNTGDDSQVNLLLQPFTATRNINLGSEVAGELSLTQTELDQFTGDVLQIGNASVPAINNPNTVVAPAGVVKMLLASSAATIEVFNSQLAGLLAGAILPMPKVEVANFSAASISAEEAAKIKVPGSVSVLFLELKFPPSTERKYKIEEVSKWTSVGVAVAGQTTGPQQAQ